MLIDQIKKDSLAARKARETNKATLLTTLYSEASMIGKNNDNRISTDAEVVQIVKKFIKGIDENISCTKLSEQKLYDLVTERDLLSIYLPIQLREDELKVVIHGIMVDQDITDIKKMGLVMKTLKEKFDGQYDGKIASKIVRETLA